MSSCRTSLPGLLPLVVLLAFPSTPGPAAPTVGISVVGTNAIQQWQRAEFRLSNIPAATQPFDPAVIRIDAAFTLPSSRVVTVPAFWFQDYQRNTSGGYEYLTPLGSGEWRVRFAPPESGAYSVSLAILTNGVPCGVPVLTNFSAAAAAGAGPFGYVRVATNRQYLETSDGQALRLIGENVAWPTTGAGTYQFDTWFAQLQSAGENYARLMCTPWSFSIETASNSLVNYSLDGAWKLDYVLQLAEQRGLYVLLCLDIHLMLQPVPDMWGPDNYWQTNPYNAANGGPCVNQDAFFTNSIARAIYQKRLRYLIARYGYSPNLVAWQLLSEIDNEYAYLNPTNVPPWHAIMGGWLHTNDPYGHLVTTSLTGGSDRPEIWTIPELDLCAYHSYGDVPPAGKIQSVTQSFLRRYGKPVLIDEFGTSSSGWNRTNDPYLRGFRQGLWGGALGGSVGTAMSWWWDSIDAENDYAPYIALKAILNRTGWGTGYWTNIVFEASGPPPSTVGNAIPGGQPFNVTLTPGGVWGASCSGRLAVTDPGAANYAATTLNSFILGSWFPTLRVPFALSTWFTNTARAVLHINSVSVSAALGVKVDGVLVLNTNLPDLDGQNVVDEEYNMDLPVNLPAGKHLVEVTNTSLGWVYLDWVRLEQVLPAEYAVSWQPTPQAVGLRGPRESLLYVISPDAVFPANANTNPLPVHHNQVLVCSNWPSGTFIAEWYDPLTASSLGISSGTTADGNLSLAMPDYEEDLAAVVYPPPRFTELGAPVSGALSVQLDSETGGRYGLEQSSDLTHWTTLLNVTNVTGTQLLTLPYDSASPQFFFRARK